MFYCAHNLNRGGQSSVLTDLVLAYPILNIMTSNMSLIGGKHAGILSVFSCMFSYLVQSFR